MKRPPGPAGFGGQNAPVASSRLTDAVAASLALSAFSLCLVTRNSSVRKLRTPSHSSMLPITLPIYSRSAHIAPCQSFLENGTTSTPESISLCPPKYFVPLCMITSAPDLNGSISGGGATVASTVKKHPYSSAFLLKYSKFLASPLGFNGVST